MFSSNPPFNLNPNEQNNKIHMEQNNPATYSITVNLNNYTLTLIKNGKIYKVYPVAIGKPKTPTPKGTFKIINKAINPGGAFGIRWLGLNAPGGGYGIHGTNNPSSIGKSISNGCIRMYNNDVLELSNLVSVGTTVKIV
jgi:lipoprotein-anchoring transpeptidase ErfK/SrfK